MISTGVANTTSTPMGMVENYKVAGKGYVNAEISQMLFIGYLSQLKHLT